MFISQLLDISTSRSNLGFCCTNAGSHLSKLWILYSNATFLSYLIVLQVNIFFFFATLWSLYKVSAGKYKQDKGTLVVVRWAHHESCCLRNEHSGIYNHSITYIYRKLLVAALILLPILGLTWVFGLLAVNEDTTVFAWIFTIFNSLQVKKHTAVSTLPLLHVKCTFFPFDTGNVFLHLPCHQKW